MSTAEEIADGFHSIQQDVVNNFERRIFFERSFERVFETDLFAVNNVTLKLFFDRQVGNIGLYRLSRLSFEQLSEFDQRVICTNIAIELSSIRFDAAG